MSIFKLKVFYGYKFDTTTFDKERLLSIIKESCDDAEKQLKETVANIKLDPDQFKVILGDLLHIDIKLQIESAWVCVFEISDKNPNVFYEIGYAIAKEKIVILLVRSDKLNDVPSDLQGVIYLTYKNENLELIKDQLTNHIISKFEQELISKANYIWFWEDLRFKSYDIYLGRTDAEDYSLADLKALDILRKNFKTNERLRINFKNEIDGDDLRNNIISFGGPKRNNITRNILKLFEGKLKLCLIPDNDKHFLIKDRQTGTEYKSEISPARAERKIDYKLRNGREYGIIYKLSNPHRPDINWFLFTGVNREGTIATIQAIFDQPIIQEIAKKAKYHSTNLEILIECDVIEGKSFGETIKEVYSF